jgi:DNA-binding transcriptional regulator GbsR (MarR family)
MPVMDAVGLNPTPDSPPQAAPKLPPVTERFVIHWGEMGSRWGVNRTVAQIHALLFISGRPMHADELCDTLGVARSNVSNSLRELQSWKLIRTVHLLGDRRDHFETSGDVWELFRVVVQERRAREFEPTMAVLRECLAHPDLAKEPVLAKQRIGETLAFMQTLSVWADEMLHLPKEVLIKLLRLGAKVQSLLRS